jgi:LCP family protein required for cell wall assembly
MFWQTAASIVLGIFIGLLIMSLTHKRPAEALVKSTLPNSGPSLSAFSPPAIQILPMLSDRMTVLIMGTDSNGRDTERFQGTRSDTMIVINMDPIGHKVGMVSIPRDSRVQIAGNHGVEKINSAHAFGGPPLSVQTVSENFCVPIDHYVVVDTQALKELCKLLGPVEVLVEKDMHYHDWAAHLHIDLKPGLQTLSPEQVEQYVRFRHDARGDLGRIERQQWFFRSAAKKLKDPQFLFRLPELIRVAHDYVQTDLSLEDMARIATFAKDIRGEDVITATLPGQAQMISGGSYWIPDLDGCRAVFNRVLGLKNAVPLIGETAPHSSDTTLDVTAELTGEPNKDNLEPASLKTSSSSADPAGLGTEYVSAVKEKPIVVAIKYCKASQEAARALESMLTEAGYKVRYMWLNSESDCQHEQITQSSGRADEGATEKLRSVCTDLKFWPVSLQMESRPITDFTIVVAPETNLAAGGVSKCHPAQRTVIPN